jgi:hypothetical protein
MSDQLYDSLQPAERSDFERNVSAKLELYRKYSEDADAWTGLDPRAGPDEKVIPMLLSELP